MRLFVALPTDDPRLVPASQALAAGGRTAPRPWHVTLAFLGDVADPQPVKAALAPLRNDPPLTVGIAGVGAFPRPERAHIGWAAIAPASLPALTDLAHRVRAATAAWNRDRRPFNAHVTLARWPSPRDVREILSRLEGLRVEVRGCATLFASHPGRPYEAVATLGAPSP
ncbi:MAG: RNA 2',3'-cyclic phosphodiesterase [Thermoplasmatota archaeon]